MDAPSSIDWAPRPDRPSRVWVAAKWFVLAGYIALVGALLVRPAQANQLFWHLLVPLLPAAFLLNVELWRNVCPLATLNSLRGQDRTARPLSKLAVRIATAVGVGTLLLFLPLRKSLLNGDGGLTALVLLGFGLLAFLSGLRFQNKAGFCNSICPVLPVERLYGPRPMVAVENARCTPCRGCTRSGCIDLGTERAVLQVLGRPAGSRRWVLTPFGAFTLAFPGIVIAFYITPATPAPPLGTSAGMLLLGGLLSWGSLGGVVTALRVRPAVALIWLAALSAGAYYWFTTVASAEAFGLPNAAGLLLRFAMLALVASWLVNGLRGSGRTYSIMPPARRTRPAER